MRLVKGQVVIFLLFQSLFASAQNDSLTHRRPIRNDKWYDLIDDITVSHLKRFKKQVVIPFARAHYYEGGKKHELDAREYHVRELELGVEWQPVPQFELVCHYTLSSRRFEDYVRQDNLQLGRLLRVQAQVNF